MSHLSETLNERDVIVHTPVDFIGVVYVIWGVIWFRARKRIYDISLSSTKPVDFIEVVYVLWGLIWFRARIDFPSRNKTYLTHQKKKKHKTYLKCLIPLGGYMIACNIYLSLCNVIIVIIFTFCVNISKADEYS